MNACNGKPEVFFTFHQVAQVCFAVVIAYFAIYAIIQHKKIFLPFFIININDAIGCKEHGIAAIPCGHYTIKHIYTHGNALQNIPWGAHTHEIAWFMCR